MDDFFLKRCIAQVIPTMMVIQDQEIVQLINGMLAEDVTSLPRMFCWGRQVLRWVCSLRVTRLGRKCVLDTPQFPSTAVQFQTLAKKQTSLYTSIPPIFGGIYGYEVIVPTKSSWIMFSPGVLWIRYLTAFKVGDLVPWRRMAMFLRPVWTQDGFTSLYAWSTNNLQGDYAGQVDGGAIVVQPEEVKRPRTMNKGGLELDFEPIVLPSINLLLRTKKRIS